MAWTFNVHTAIHIKEGVRYQRGLLQMVLLWTRLLWTRSVTNVVCFEWCVMSGLLWTGLFWMGTILNHWYIFVSHEFAVIGFSAKAPSYWRWWWKLHMLQ